MIEGQVIKMGGREWVIPPLNLKRYKQAAPLIAQIGGAGMAEDAAVMAQVIHLAMQRNYPDLTLDQVEDMVDLGNMADVFGAVIKVSGLDPKPMPGKVEAAAP